MKFTEFGFNPNLVKALQAHGFTETTQVQEKTIPALLRGQDAVVRSQTGSGKTLAYCLPIIQKINYDNAFIQSLVICPTRELALQVAAEIKKIIKFLPNMNVVAIYGGSDISRQIRELKQKPQIIVGTPGRIMDHLNRRTLKLQNLTSVVLDEADEMLNMGFKEDIESILAFVPKKRQTLMFSATYPQSIKDIVNNYLTDPVSIEVGSENKSLANINQHYVHVNKMHKKDSLLQLFEKLQPKHSIVFTNTKRMAEEIANLLNGSGFSALALHGDLRQSQRKKVLADVKKSNNITLVASDVAARGIDINDIDYVVNYDIPHNTEYFLHRIGRTARAGKSGSAVTIVTTKDQLNHLKEIEKETNSIIKELILTSSMSLRNEKGKNANYASKNSGSVRERKDNSKPKTFTKKSDSFENKNSFSKKESFGKRESRSFDRKGNFDKKDGFAKRENNSFKGGNTQKKVRDNFEEKNSNSKPKGNDRYNKPVDNYATRNTNSGFKNKQDKRNFKSYDDGFKKENRGFVKNYSFNDETNNNSNERRNNSNKRNTSFNRGKSKNYSSSKSYSENKPYEKTYRENSFSKDNEKGSKRTSLKSQGFSKSSNSNKTSSYKNQREEGGRNYFSKFTGKKTNTRKRTRK